MNGRCRVSLAACLGLLTGMAFGQTRPDVAIKTTLCELVKAPKQFDGRLVQIIATVGLGLESMTLADDSCPASVLLSVGEKSALGKLEYADIHSIDDIRHPEGLDWRLLPPRQPVTLKRDRAFRRFDKYLGKNFKSKVPHEVCVNCPLYRVSATLVGRFDHTDRTWRMVRGADADKVPSSMGFGHLNSWDSQFVLQSVSNVVAKPIDPSVYDRAE